MSKFTKAKKSQAKLRMALVGVSGSGKAQPTYCQVMTPGGWRDIGSLRVGDLVSDPDGGTGAVEAVFPQGPKETFTVTLSDGSSTECCAEHLWLTQDINDRAKLREGEVRPLSMIKETLKRSFPTSEDKPNHYVPMVRHVDVSSAPLPIDPWLMGVIIGDGCLAGGNSITISKPGKEIRDAVERCLPDDLHITEIDDISFGIRKNTGNHHSMVDLFRTYGLMGKKSVDKHIPDEYMLSTFENRVALLQGLIDTDGYVNEYSVEYSTSSKVLASQFQELVRSVGGTCSFSSRLPHYTHNGERRTGHENWRMQVSLPADVLPVRLSGKLNRYKPRSKYPPYRSFSSIEPSGIKECVCIKVSTKRNLYITDDYIVTHNTYSALKIGSLLGKRVALIDTERASASKYADLFEFDSLCLDEYSPSTYVAAINDAAKAGYDVLVIDSLSHAWFGKGGALEMADNASKKGGNRFTAWRDVTPEQNKLVEAILSAPMHLIATMRAKTEYALEQNEKGKMVPKKVGMQAIQKDSIEFEFDVVADMTTENDFIVSKTRCPALSNKVFNKPGQEVADILNKWLSDGEPEEIKPKTVPAMPAAVLSSKQELMAAAETVVAEGQPVTATVNDGGVSLWTTKINETKSVAELKNLGGLLKGLPTAVQIELSKPYREQLKSLESTQ